MGKTFSGHAWGAQTNFFGGGMPGKRKSLPQERSKKLPNLPVGCMQNIYQSVLIWFWFSQALLVVVCVLSALATATAVFALVHCRNSSSSSSSMSCCCCFVPLSDEDSKPPCCCCPSRWDVLLLFKQFFSIFKNSEKNRLNSKDS